MTDELLRDALEAYTMARDDVPGGAYATEHPDFIVIRGERETPLEHAFYEAALIYVVQGAKELLLGDARFTYAAGQYLVLGLGLPVLAKITHATVARPYLAVGLAISPALISELDVTAERDTAPEPAASGSALFVGTAADRERSAFGALAHLVAEPGATRALYEPTARAIFYWLLRGRGGEAFRRLVVPGSHARRITAAIGLMRGELATSRSIDELAAVAGMSASSFHEHFKHVTSMSPLQYQKRLRLLEARRLMLSRGADATRAAYEVGYESVSQFSREYARMFGAPPGRDVASLRVAAS